MTTRQPRVLAGDSMVPPFPIGGLKDFKQTEMYLRRLANALKMDRGQVGNRVERRILHGLAAERPTADGGGNVYYATDTEEYDIDTGTWENVVTSGGVSDHGGLSGLDDVDDHSWAVKDDGDTMTGEFVMSGASSWITQYYGAPGIRYGNDPYYNVIKGVTLNAIYVGDSALSLAFYGSPDRPWYNGNYLALLDDITEGSLLDHADTPSDYATYAGYGLGVNSAEDAVEFARFVKVAGDTMTGVLEMGANAWVDLKTLPATPASGIVSIGRATGDLFRIVSPSGYMDIGVVAGSCTIGSDLDDLYINLNFQFSDAGATDVTRLIEFENSGSQMREGVKFSRYDAFTFSDDNCTTDIRGSDTRPTYKGSDLALLSDTGGGGGSDTDAIHISEADEFAEAPLATAQAVDRTFFEDWSDSWEKKYTTFNDLPLVSINGDTMTGFLTLHANPVNSDHAATKNYVDTEVASRQYTFLNLTDTPASYPVGSGQYGVRVLSGEDGLGFATSADTYFGGNVVLDNNNDFSVRNSGGTPIQLLSLNGSNQCYIGTGSYQVYIQGSGTVLCLDHFGVNGAYDFLLGTLGSSALRQYDGGALRDLITMNGDTDTVVGNTEGRTILQSNGSIRIPGLASGIFFETAASAFSSMLLLAASTFSVGNLNRDLILLTDTKVEISGGFLELGGNNIDMSGGNILTAGGDIQMDYGDKLTIEDSGSTARDMLWCSGTSRIFGSTVGETWVEGSPLKLYRYGYSGSAVPSATNWPTVGSWGIHIDDGSIYLVYQNGTVPVGVELTALW